MIIDKPGSIEAAEKLSLGKLINQAVATLSNLRRDPRLNDDERSALTAATASAALAAAMVANRGR